MNLQSALLCHSTAQEEFGRFPSPLTLLETSAAAEEQDFKLSDLLSEGLAMYPHGCVPIQPHTEFSANTVRDLPNSFNAFAHACLELTMSRVQQDPKFSHAQLEGQMSSERQTMLHLA